MDRVEIIARLRENEAAQRGRGVTRGAVRLAQTGQRTRRQGHGHHAKAGSAPGACGVTMGRKPKVTPRQQKEAFTSLPGRRAGSENRQDLQRPRQYDFKAYGTR
jgi:hypothetical protein